MDFMLPDRDNTDCYCGRERCPNQHVFHVLCITPDEVWMYEEGMVGAWCGVGDTFLEQVGDSVDYIYHDAYH